MEQYSHADITKRILGAAFEVHGALGPGFLESIYEEALVKEFQRNALAFRRQPEIDVSYKGEIIGTHRLDLLVEGCVVVELKAVNNLIDAHSATALSYLTATGLSVALLLNFSKPSLEYKRLVRNHK